MLWLLRLLPLGVILAHLAASPYTKVEESFNMQATHDILFTGNLSQYDHNTYPGAVPRTFIGSWLLAAPSLPFSRMPQLAGDVCDRVQALLAVRATLGCAHAFGLDRVVCQVRTLFGSAAAATFLLLTCAQFHQLYYASRTLPNSFAMVGFLLGLAELLKAETVRKADGVRSRRFGLQLLAFSCVVFRADMVVFIGPLVLTLLATGRVPFWSTALLGVVSGAASILASVAVDSAMWGWWLWPEGVVLWFNTVDNQSSNWGTSPWWWYWGNALPRALLTVYPIGVVAAWSVVELRFVALPALAFVGLYSILPHKELRFIFYALPVLNMCAAALLARLSVRRPYVRFLVALVCLSSACATVGFATASAGNYPSGPAMRWLHSNASGGSVHIDVASSMAGVTRFQKNWCAGEDGRPLWTYSKVPGAEKAADGSPFDFRITFQPGNFTGSGYSVVHVEQAFAGIDRARIKALDLWPPPLRYTDAVFVMRRQ